MNSPIVAHTLVHESIIVPKTIVVANNTITQEEDELSPYPNCNYISCIRAWPHRDTGLYDKGKKFIILSVRGDHVFGQEGYKSDIYPVPSGTIFIVDPSKIHWLFPRADYYSSLEGPSKAKWIGLSWSIKSSKVKEELPKIVDMLSGVMHDNVKGTLVSKNGLYDNG